MPDYPLTFDGPQDPLRVHQSGAVRIGCRTEPLSFWVEEAEDVLVPTDEALELAENADYSRGDWLWYVDKLTQLWRDGALGFQDKATGQIPDGPEWTTDLEEECRRGDLVLAFKDREDQQEWLEEQGVKSGTPPFCQVYGVCDGITLEVAMDDDRVEGMFPVLLKTSTERDSSQRQVLDGVCTDCGYGSNHCTCLPDWVDEDKEYELPDGRVGVPSEYRPPRTGEFYLLDGTVFKSPAGTMHHMNRVILEPRNVAPSYWHELGVDPDETWQAGAYKLKDEKPRIPEKGDRYLLWKPPNSDKEWGFVRCETGPGMEHPELGKKRPILEEVE